MFLNVPFMLSKKKMADYINKTINKNWFGRTSSTLGQKYIESILKPDKGLKYESILKRAKICDESISSEKKSEKPKDSEDLEQLEKELELCEKNYREVLNFIETFKVNSDETWSVNKKEVQAILDKTAMGKTPLEWLALLGRWNDVEALLLAFKDAIPRKKDPWHVSQVFLIAAKHCGVSNWTFKDEDLNLTSNLIPNLNSKG